MGVHYKLNEIRSFHKPVFFDANILIYLFWPTGNQRYEKNYARAFNQLRKNANELYLNFSVVSEVINRVARIEQNKSGNQELSFKKFRNSAEGEEALNDIYVLFEDVILPQFEIIDKSFNKEELTEFLYYDQLDFNDKGIAQICRDEDLVLITNDSDFKDSELTILSGHPAFFH